MSDNDKRFEDPYRLVKKTMLKEQTMRYLEQDLKKLSVDHNWKGSGTEIDPFIVNSPHPFPEDYNISFKDSNHYIIFNQCTFHSFKFKNSANISFNSCQMNDLSLLRSTGIFITKGNIRDLLVKASFRIDIKETSIISLNLMNSFMNSIKGGSIQKINKMRSPDNIIDVDNISEEYKLRGNRFPANFLALIIMFIMFQVTFSYIYFAFLLEINFILGLIVSYCMLIILSSGMAIAVVKIQRLGKNVKIYYTEKRIIYPNLKQQILGGILITLGIIIVDIFYTISIFQIDNWSDDNLRIIVSISFIILSSFLISLGVNHLLRSRPFNTGLIKEGVNPLYPFFIPSVTFFIPIILLIGLGLSIETLKDMDIQMNFLFIIAFVIFQGISLSTFYKFKKVIKTEEKLAISEARFRQIFGTLLLVISFLLFYVYFGLILKGLAGSYIIGILVAIFSMGLCLTFGIGFGSFNKLTSAPDLFSAYRSFEEGEYDEALTYYKNLIEQDPKNINTLSSLGAVYIKLEQYKNALDTFSHILKLDPDSKLAWNGLGVVYNLLEEYDKAIETLEKGLSLPKKPVFASKWTENLSESLLQFSIDDRIFYNLANTYLKKGDFEKAVETCEGGFKLNTKFEDLWELFITIYLQKEELDKCIEICERCINSNPKFEKIYNLLGIVYRRKDNLSKALEVLNKAHKINPENHQTCFNLAVVYLDLKEFRNAIIACNLSLRFKPNNPTVIKFREKILKELSQN